MGSIFGVARSQVVMLGLGLDDLEIMDVSESSWSDSSVSGLGLRLDTLNAI